MKLRINSHIECSLIFFSRFLPYFFTEHQIIVYSRMKLFYNKHRIFAFKSNKIFYILDLTMKHHTISIKLNL